MLQRKDSAQDDFLNTLDFSLFLHGSKSDRQAISGALAENLRRTGFVKLKNYGVSHGEIDELFDLSRRYFGLSEAQKMSGAHPANPYPHRGYSFVGQESISGISGFEKGRLEEAVLKDNKETFDMGSAHDTEFPNTWPHPEFLPDFRRTMEHAFARHHECLQTVLESLAIGLGVRPDLFTSKHHRQEHEFRLLHYPKMPAEHFAEGKGNVRIAEHSDFGSLTFLLQDGTGGLFVEDQQAERVFHSVESAPYEVILNVGDCLQRWTGGLLRSANHKVCVPQQATGSAGGSVPERFSIAFFGKPDRAEKVGALLEWATESSLQYDNITAGEYNMQKLLRTY